MISSPKEFRFSSIVFLLSVCSRWRPQKKGIGSGTGSLSKMAYNVLTGIVECGEGSCSSFQLCSRSFIAERSTACLSRARHNNVFSLLVSVIRYSLQLFVSNGPVLQSMSKGVANKGLVYFTVNHSLLLYCRDYW
jgi:hypothetical protein